MNLNDDFELEDECDLSKAQKETVFEEIRDMTNKLHPYLNTNTNEFITIVQTLAIEIDELKMLIKKLKKRLSLILLLR